MNEEQNVPISTLNRMIGNVKNFYFALLDKGWYLPSYNKGSLSFSYLWNVFSDKCFRIQREKVKKAIVFKNLTKMQVFEALNAKVRNLGFQTEKLPEKQWMLDVLYTIDPENRIFNREEGIIEEPKVSVSMK